MTLQFFDGLKDANIMRKPSWSAGAAWNLITTGRFGDTNGAAKPGWGNGATNACKLTLPTPAATVVYGIAANVGSSSTDGLPLGGIAIASGVNQLATRVNASGFIEVYRNTVPTGTLLATSTGHAPIVGFNYYELKASLATSGGTLIVRLNNIEVINFTGQTAATAGNVAMLNFSSPQTDATVTLDDLYVCDTVDATATQGRANNDFLGDLKVACLLPTGAGDSTQWTPSTGANWTTVDDVPPNITDYVSDPTSGHRDLYVMSDLTGTIGAVYGVQTSLYAAKSDAGAVTMKPTIKESGGTVTSDTAVSPGTTFGPFHGTMRMVRPSDSAVWTASDVNALQAGVEVV